MDITFDTAPLPGLARFAGARYTIVAWDPDDVAPALDAMAAAQDQGAWLAGCASYELGHVLEPSLLPLLPARRDLPLLAFGVYDAPRPAQPVPSGPFDLGAMRPRWDQARYQQAFDEVHADIGAGVFYQANLTFPVDFEISGDSGALYHALVQEQPVRHGALIRDLAGHDVLCRSPELFFRVRSDQTILTRPMKGTQPRSADPVWDAQARDFLLNDPKNRAENLMIVDLLRNDVSRVTRAGSVRVPRLFHVESYATVHQMVSDIEGELLPGTNIADILRALFPCGSIVGAPKVKAIERLAQLEPWPRGIYCGSIGWVAPDGQAEFNVAIRTLVRRPGDSGVLNVGGGVVWDSTGPSEYEEALWKSRFAKISPRSFD